MHTVAIWAVMEAKPGKEGELEEFLKAALQSAQGEPGTTTWYALKLGPSRYGIFDTFADNAARQASLSGPIAKALMEKAGELLANAPEIEQAEILAVKAPGV